MNKVTQKTLEEIKYDSADRYALQFKQCGATDVGRRSRSFCYGFDAGVKAMQERAQVLVDAMEILIKNVPVTYRDPKAKEALENYKKSMELK